MGMTYQKALTILAIENPQQAAVSYQAKVLQLLPVEVSANAVAEDINRAYIQGQKRFAELTEAYQIVLCQQPADDVEQRGLGPNEMSQSSFWTHFRGVSADLPQVAEVYKALFLAAPLSPAVPNVYQISYGPLPLGDLTVSFSTKDQLMKQVQDFVGSHFTSEAGTIRFPILNFPKEWLNEILPLIQANRNITSVTFPEGYQLPEGDKAKWEALIKNAGEVAQWSFNLKSLQTFVEKNPKPVIGGVATTFVLGYLIGGILLPLLCGIGATFGSRFVMKRLKEYKDHYTPAKVQSLEGQPEAAIFHLGERAAQGFYPFKDAVCDPRIREKPAHFEAFLAGLQTGWDQPSENRPKVN